MLRQDFFQENPKFRNVPLTLAQVVEELALGALTIDLECQIKRSARGYHPKVAVEHDQRLGDGIHDGLRQSSDVLNPQKGLNVGHDVGSFDLTPARKSNSRRALERKLSK